MEKKIKTKREMRTIARHKKVIEEYEDIKSKNPTASHHAICIAVGENLDMARVSIHRIVTAQGLYKPNRRVIIKKELRREEL